MGKIRTVKKTNYSIISNNILWDKRLSVKARFVLIFCLSLADNWEYNVNGLAISMGISYNAVADGLNELREYGYLQRTRLFDERNKFAGFDYTFYEEPIEIPYKEKPLMEKPLMEKPLLEKQRQLNTNTLNTKELNNNIILGNGEDAISLYMKHIHPTPSSSLVEKINDLANEVGLSVFKEACEIAEKYGKRSLAYVEGVAINIKNGNRFDDKPKQPEVDYWEYMLKGVADDGDKQD